MAMSGRWQWQASAGDAIAGFVYQASGSNQTLTTRRFTVRRVGN